MSAMFSPSRYLFTFLFILQFTIAYSKSYYISTLSGNDSYTPAQAQSFLTPWKSVSRLNSFFPNINPGDSILFKRGEVFEGALIINKSGSASQSIVFGAYGTGSKPVITGFNTVNAWKNSGINIWESISPVSTLTTANMVVIGGVNTPMARFPKKGWNKINNSNSSSITDLSLGSINWTGAEVVIRKERWVIDRSTISSQAGNTLNFASGEYIPKNGWGYFIQNDIRALTQQNDWYYNPATKKISIYSSSIPGNVKLSVHNYLVNLSSENFISIENISFEGSNISAFLLDNAKNIKLLNCSIDYSGINAITASSASTSLSLINNSFNQTNNNAVELGSICFDATITGNKITNTGMIAGAGRSSGDHTVGQGLDSYSAIIHYGSNVLIEGNTIENTGYLPIRFMGNNILVQKNTITDFCSVKDDGAGIYTWGNPGSPSNRKIINNMISNGIGAGDGTAWLRTRSAEGIYIDDNASQVEISGNTVSNCSKGIYLHNAYNNQISDNLLFNNDVHLYMSHNKSHSTIRNNSIVSNTFFSKKESQIAAKLISEAGDTRLFGIFENNKYANPFHRDMQFIMEEVTSTGKNSFRVFDFTGWQKVFGQDINSVRSIHKFPGYTLKNLIGSNKYPYGEFTGGLSATYSFSEENNITSSFDNTGKIDGTGSLKISYTKPTLSKGWVAFGNALSVESNKKYILKFSSLGKTDARVIGVYLRKAQAPYTELTSKQYITLTAAKGNYEMMFSFPDTEADANIFFELNTGDGEIWFDNVALYEADVSITNPDNHIRFEYNAANAVRTISLEKVYVDAANKEYQGKLTLQPYSSVVLIASGKVIGKTTQTITFPAISAKSILEVPFALTATASSGLPVSFKMISGPATISGNMITLTGAGIATIEAAQTGDDRYAQAISIQQSFTINEVSPDIILSNQNITFGSIPDKTFGHAPFGLIVTSSSGLPANLKVLSGPATFKDNLVSITGAGTVVIEASQEGNKTYKPASSVQQTFTVKKADQTISFDSIPDKKFGDPPFLLKAVTNSGLSTVFTVFSGPANILGNIITLTGPGTVAIEASQTGSENYHSAPTQTRRFLITTVNQNSGSTNSSGSINPDFASLPDNKPQMKTYPNPFTGKLNIEFKSSKSEQARLQVFNAQGKMERELFSGSVRAGEINKISLDASEWISGVYIVRILTPRGTLFQKVILTK